MYLYVFIQSLHMTKCDIRSIFNRISKGLNLEFSVADTNCKFKVCPLFTHSWRVNRWILSFPNC